MTTCWPGHLSWPRGTWDVSYTYSEFTQLNRPHSIHPPCRNRCTSVGGKGSVAAGRVLCTGWARALCELDRGRCGWGRLRRAMAQKGRLCGSRPSAGSEMMSLGPLLSSAEAFLKGGVSYIVTPITLVTVSGRLPLLRPFSSPPLHPLQVTGPHHHSSFGWPSAIQPLTGWLGYSSLGVGRQP